MNTLSNGIYTQTIPQSTWSLKFTKRICYSRSEIKTNINIYNPTVSYYIIDVKVHPDPIPSQSQTIRFVGRAQTTRIYKLSNHNCEMQIIYQLHFIRMRPLHGKCEAEDGRTGFSPLPWVDIMLLFVLLLNFFLCWQMCITRLQTIMHKGQVIYMKSNLMAETSKRRYSCIKTFETVFIFLRKNWLRRSDVRIELDVTKVQRVL